MEEEIRSLKDIKDIGLLKIKSDEDDLGTIYKKAEILISWILGLTATSIPVFTFVLKYFFKINKYFFYFSLIPSVIIVLFFLSALIFSTLVSRTEVFSSIDFIKIWDYEKNLKEFNEAKIQKRFINHIYKIHKINKPIIDKKSKMLKYSFRTFFTGLILLILIAITNTLFFLI